MSAAARGPTTTRGRDRAGPPQARPQAQTLPPIALVTGGAIRVGRATSEALARAGYGVWIHAHQSLDRAHALATTLREHGDAGAQVVAADLTRDGERGRLAETIADPHGPFGGRLDLVVNNAAGFEHRAFADGDDDSFRRVLELTLVAPISLVRRLLGPLRAAAERTEGRACVVNILDILGLHPATGYFEHGTAKAALTFATVALAAELAPIRVNGVAPGTVAWPDDAHYAPGAPARAAIERAIPAGRIGSPADVAQAVVFLASGGFISGACVPVDGGAMAGCAGPHK